MIEIPDPPTQRVCASCSSPLSWLWSPRSRSWIAVVRVDAETVRLHGCRTAGAPLSWRDVPRRSEPTPEYLAAKAALTGAAKSNEGETTT